MYIYQCWYSSVRPLRRVIKACLYLGFWGLGVYGLGVRVVLHHIVVYLFMIFVSSQVCYIFVCMVQAFKLYFGVYLRLCIHVHDSGFQLYFGVYFRLCICAGLTGLWFIVQKNKV